MCLNRLRVATLGYADHHCRSEDRFTRSLAGPVAAQRIERYGRAAAGQGTGYAWRAKHARTGFKASAGLIEDRDARGDQAALGEEIAGPITDSQQPAFAIGGRNEEQPAIG